MLLLVLFTNPQNLVVHNNPLSRVVGIVVHAVVDMIDHVVAGMIDHAIAGMAADIVADMLVDDPFRWSPPRQFRPRSSVASGS